MGCEGGLKGGLKDGLRECSQGLNESIKSTRLTN